MTATTALRATDLPLPVIGITPALFITGTVAHGVKLPTVVIGEATYGIDAQGGIWTTCYRCSGRGFMAEYAGIYAGECFACRYRGAKKVADSAEKMARKVRSEQAAALRLAAKLEAERPAREAAEAKAMAEMLEKAWDEAQEEAARRAAREAELAEMRYAGEVGTKVTVQGIVKVSMSVDGFRPGSYSRLVIIEGTGPDQGVTLKTVGTSDAHYEMERGEAVKVTATVKAHTTYNGVPQTQVIRPKLG